MKRLRILLMFPLLAILQACGGNLEDASTAGQSAAEAMAGDTTGYARATGPIEFDFPDDHGPHPEYKTEWWYLTGNLDGEDGLPYAYQFTIFRIGLQPPGQSVSADTVNQDAPSWRADQMYMAHFGISDIQNEHHIHGERFSRGAAGLAGAEGDSFRVWVDDWKAHAPSGEEPFPMTIEAKHDNAEINLAVVPRKPRVYQGDEGYSQKGPLPGDASYYFSYTRLDTEGWIAIDGDTTEVSGYSWMDREWSTSALSEEQVGWDWFSLQLDNEYEMMFYHIREESGGISPFSKGLLIRPDGSTDLIDVADVDLTMRNYWTSPHGGEYPVSWTLEYHPEDMVFEIDAFFPDQEMVTSVRYWEGAVQIEGTHDGSTVTGRGYVEMTGYGDQQALPR